jgi:hypothetical protein
MATLLAEACRRSSVFYQQLVCCVRLVNVLTLLFPSLSILTTYKLPIVPCLYTETLKP